MKKWLIPALMAIVLVATLTACHCPKSETRKPPMQSVRIIEIPDCKMVSSGSGMFGEEKFDRFDKWFSSQPHAMYPHDFLGQAPDGNGLVWHYLYEDGMDTEDFDVVDFKGGLYAVTTDIDQRTDIAAMDAAIHEFLAVHNLEQDHSRARLGHIISTPSARAALGYSQMDYFMPVKPR